MTTDSWEEEDRESLASSSDSDEDDDDISSTVLLAVAAVAAAVVSTVCIAETSPSTLYDGDRSKWKVPKIIECKPNLNDKVEAADLPEKESDMEQIGTLGTSSTSLSSLSSNGRRATNHRANKRRSSEILAQAIRDVNSALMQAEMQAKMQKLACQRKYEEIRHKYEEIRRKKLKTDKEPAIEELGMMNK